VKQENKSNFKCNSKLVLVYKFFTRNARKHNQFKWDNGEAVEFQLLFQINVNFQILRRESRKHNQIKWDDGEARE
jgi:hypothetical protein